MDQNPQDPNQGGMPAPTQSEPADPNAGQPVVDPNVGQPAPETPAPEAPVETPQQPVSEPGISPMGGDQGGPASPAGSAPMM